MDMETKLHQAEEQMERDILILSNDVTINHPSLFEGSIEPERKLYAAIAYLVTGSSVKAEHLSGVRSNTIRRWKKEAPWWPDAMRAYRMAKADSVDAKLTSIIDRSLKAVEDRLDNGDEVILQKTGEIIRKKISGKDAAVISAVMIDKQQLLRGNPTQRIEKTSQEDNLKDLRKQFADFTKAKTIEGEVVKD